MVVLLTLLWIRACLRLGGNLYAIIGGVLNSFPVDGFFQGLSIDFSCLG